MRLLSKLKSAFAYSRLMGLEWFLFRVRYEIRKRTTYFDNINYKIIKKVSQADKEMFFYKKIGLIRDDLKGDASFVEKADAAIEGKIFAFSHNYLDYTQNGIIDWQMNPVSKIKADRTLPWNRLSDFGEYGDIKLIWEASRFPQVYFFIHAYAVTDDKKYARACISQIVEWIDANPYPKGVNYKCGQEITFRICAWINALEYFERFIDKKEEQKIVANIYVSLLRIDANIDYAAKSVKNNHSISEAAGLFIGGLLFEQLQESRSFLEKGLRYLLQETSYQIYEDGSYIQHSFMYQRLALDVLSFVFLVAEKKRYELPEVLRERHKKMICFLSAFMQEDGRLPNYGSNDGSNLFPVKESDYLDFRVSLDFAKGESEFFDIPNKKSVACDDKKRAFEDGGYYILKNENFFCFIRSHSYRHRPASNDMLHLDVWYKGENILCDSGSYSYNTDKKFKSNFIGVLGHNTVMIEDEEYMPQVLNFGFSNWTQAKTLEFSASRFVAQNYAYKKRFGVIHQREVQLQEDKIIVIDKIKGVKKRIDIKQIWNTCYSVEPMNRFSVKVGKCIITSNIEYNCTKGYISKYYNSYKEGTRVIFETQSDQDFEIETVIACKES